MASDRFYDLSDDFRLLRMVSDDTKELRLHFNSLQKGIDGFDQLQLASGDFSDDSR